MHAAKPRVETVVPALPSLRFEVSEAAQILRMSRAQPDSRWITEAAKGLGAYLYHPCGAGTLRAGLRLLGT